MCMRVSLGKDLCVLQCCWICQFAESSARSCQGVCFQHTAVVGTRELASCRFAILGLERSCGQWCRIFSAPHTTMEVVNSQTPCAHMAAPGLMCCCCAQLPLAARRQADQRQSDHNRQQRPVGLARWQA
jgi:hypothetical protein